MTSKVPGLVITVPPTAKLPCSWMISGTGLSFRLIVVHAEATMPAAISKSALNDLRCFAFIELSQSGRGRTIGSSQHGAHVRLQLLPRGPEQDLVHVHVFGLADG